MVDASATINNQNVVVLIPPPVDPGDAPININIKINHKDDMLNSLISMVEKPAVRADIE